MTITLEQITAHKERLQREVVERECIIAGLNVLQTFVQSQPAKKPMEFGSFVSVLAPAAIDLPLMELTETTAPEAEAVPAPVAPPPQAYMHPELRALAQVSHGTNSRLVSWAIERMTDDYSLSDLAALLKREGHPLAGPQLSVVLSRLKRRGEIQEVKPAAGPYPAIYRKPESAILPEPESADTMNETGTTKDPAAAA
jgi:hypothetical protein